MSAGGKDLLNSMCSRSNTLYVWEGTIQPFPLGGWKINIYSVINVMCVFLFFSHVKLGGGSSRVTCDLTFCLTSIELAVTWQSRLKEKLIRTKLTRRGPKGMSYLGGKKFY